MPIDIDRLLRETNVAQVEYRPSLTSTNDRAAEMALQNTAALPLLVVADEQTAGRGRGSNRWWTGPGALAFSLLMDAETVAAVTNRSPLVALAAGVAVAESLAPLLPGRGVGIHWPNDVYVTDRKLAGILVEVLANRRHILGIGINTNNTTADAPPELQSRVATLRDLSGQQHDQTSILIDLLARLDSQFTQLRDSPAAVTQRANELCLQRGQSLTIERPDGPITARCAGIAADGALLLKTAAGPHSVYSGTVVTSAP